MMNRELFSCRTESPDLILGILGSLASVRRFDMAVMFMSTPEKKGSVYNVAIHTFTCKTNRSSLRIISYLFFIHSSSGAL